MLREVVEVCPHCDSENIMFWNVERDGYIARCQHCGKPMFLCDECQHPDGEYCDRCDWHEERNGKGQMFSVCFRGKYLAEEVL